MFYLHNYYFLNANDIYKVQQYGVILKWKTYSHIFQVQSLNMVLNRFVYEMLAFHLSITLSTCIILQKLSPTRHLSKAKWTPISIRYLLHLVVRLFLGRWLFYDIGIRSHHNFGYLRRSNFYQNWMAVS